MQIIKNKKFSEKIFKVFLVISVLPLLLVAVNSVNVTVKTRKQNIAELQALAIETAGEKIKNFLDQKIETFHLVVSAPVSNLAEVDESNLNHLVESVRTAAGDVSEISFINKNGAELVKRGGTVRAQDFAPLQNISANPEFKATAGGKNYFGPVVYTENGPVMRLAAPVENKDKEIIGAISAIVDLKSLKSIVEKIKLGETGFIYAVDDAGYLIAAGKPFARNGDNLKNINLVNDLVKGNFHDGLEKNDRYVNSLRDEVVFAGRPMGKVNWFIASEWPKNDAFGVIDSIIKQSIIIAIFSFILVIALALIMTRQVVKPIEALNRGAAEISKGNLGYRLDLKTGDEFETLGAKFNEMIKALNENRKLRDEFVFIAAHELRTPVTAIKGYLSMITDGSFGKVPAKIAENLKIVNGANQRLVQLVADLLEVARDESGTLKIALTPLSMKESANIAIEELASVAKEKRIKIKHNNKFADKKVKADAYKLKEVLVNLVSNAIKYTPAGGVIEISHEIHPGAYNAMGAGIKSDYLITHVKDNGIGIAPENINKLFAKFYRIKTRKTASVEGTGLGLFICKEIVERMQGKIWVSSELGKGSTFSFSLLLT
ncbi:sensor histidine kinase [Candidatus Falkowbacteria bacterium]|nr:sensor histidine kinase [Candidatus Falkowbacteria bacterium]